MFLRIKAESGSNAKSRRANVEITATGCTISRLILSSIWAGRNFCSQHRTERTAVCPGEIQLHYENYNARNNCRGGDGNVKRENAYDNRRQECQGERHEA